MFFSMDYDTLGSKHDEFFFFPVVSTWLRSFCMFERLQRQVWGQFLKLSQTVPVGEFNSFFFFFFFRLSDWEAVSAPKGLDNSSACFGFFYIKAGMSDARF